MLKNRANSWNTVLNISNTDIHDNEDGMFFFQGYSDTLDVTLNDCNIFNNTCYDYEFLINFMDAGKIAFEVDK